MKRKSSGSHEKKIKPGSTLEQSLKTMQSSEDYQELAEENRNLHYQINKLTTAACNLEDQIQRLLKLQLGGPQSQATLSQANFDIMIGFKRSCQAQRNENHRLLQQISFLKKSKKLTTLHEQTIELNQLNKYCQKQAKIINNMQEYIKTLEKPKEKKVEPSLETLKQHINDYQLILGKEENKIHELQNFLHKERTKNKELLAQLGDQQKQIENFEALLERSRKETANMRESAELLEKEKRQEEAERVGRFKEVATQVALEPVDQKTLMIGVDNFEENEVNVGGFNVASDVGVVEE